MYRRRSDGITAGKMPAIRKAMPFLFDGYNIYHAAAKMSDAWSHITPGGLCALLAEDLTILRDNGVCVFDGAPPRGSDWAGKTIGPLTTLFSGPGREADCLLEQLIKENTAPRRLVVVSSDNRVKRAARRRRAQTIIAREYLISLLQRRDRPAPPPREPRAKHEGVPPGQLNEWLEFFGIDPDHPGDENDRIRLG
ncbi:MAG: NYN domain-containing protein [Sedimentisphaerales bacterium]|nr:NYN domain-containing protein [Sedimentisphaerales bacterium]